MLESGIRDGNDADHRNDGAAHDAVSRYGDAARAARQVGALELAVHLYLAAYEQGCVQGHDAPSDAVDALRCSWEIACELRERSLAEYIHERLEPFLSEEEARSAGRAMQDMALDKLSEIGIARADIESIADMIAEEAGIDGSVAKITPIVTGVPLKAVASEAADAPCDAGGALMLDAASDDAASSVAVALGAPSSAGRTDDAASERKASKAAANPMRFSDLIGFDAAVEEVRSLGIGIDDDEEYRALIEMLRARHGIEGTSAAGSIVFRTSSREDAGLLMAATAGELGLPTMRVQMQPGPQGMPVLCVSTLASKPLRPSANKLSFESPGVLVLEDVDMWAAPLMDAAAATEGDAAASAAMARAAREAFALIGSAVGNPDVYVLASMAGDTPDQGFLYDMMEPMHIVDLYLPDEIERRTIWNAIADDHPSIAELDLGRLTRVSRNLSRFDIASAAREAVEDAYRRSLKARRYVSVTQEMMFEHIANFQPLESDEYRFLEEAVATEFRNRIEELEQQSFPDADADAGEKGDF